MSNQPKTALCHKCHGKGYTSRYAVTSRVEGIIKMRYTPIEPRPCSCARTA